MAFSAGKRNIKRRLALVLAAVLVMCALAACSKEDTTALFTYKDEVVTAGMFSYMVASQKAYVKEIFEAYTSDYYSEHGTYPYGTDDFNEFLKQTMQNGGNGLTYAQNAFNTVKNTAKMFVVVNHFCKKYNLNVTDPAVISDIENAINADINDAGGLILLNEILAEFDADVNTAREYLYNMAKVELLYEYLYGDRGIQRVADSLVSDKFYTEYRKIDFVYYPYYKISTETGEREFLSAEEKEKLRVEADDFYAKLLSGEVNFSDYSKHDKYAKYDEGLCYTDGNLDPVLEEQADKLAKAGDTVKVELDEGVYIIRLLQATDDDFINYYDQVYEVLAKKAYYEYLESFYSEIKINESALAKYDFTEYPPLVID